MPYRHSVDAHDVVAATQQVAQQVKSGTALTRTHCVKELEYRNRGGLHHHAGDVVACDLRPLARIGDDLVRLDLQATQVATDRPHQRLGPVAVESPALVLEQPYHPRWILAASGRLVLGRPALSGDGLQQLAVLAHLPCHEHKARRWRGVCSIPGKDRLVCRLHPVDAVHHHKPALGCEGQRVRRCNHVTRIRVLALERLEVELEVGDLGYAPTETVEGALEQQVLFSVYEIDRLEVLETLHDH